MVSYLLLQTGDHLEFEDGQGDLLLEINDETFTGQPGPFGSEVSIEFSPTTGPLATPVWVDITNKVRLAAGVLTDRGRSSELDEFQVGKASFTLNNRDRRFDPMYTAGPYYGNLKVLRQFRIRVRYNSIVYTLFTGFIQGWPQVYDEQADNEATVPVQLLDAFSLLTLSNLFDSGGFTLNSATLGVLGEDRFGISGDDTLIDAYSGERAEAILDAVGFSPIDADRGQSTVSSAAPTGSLLSYMRQLEKSEDGFFYMAGNGVATFLDRTSRQTLTRIGTSQVTFDDDGTDSSYSDITFTHDLERLYNDVRRTGTSGEEQSAENASSIDSFFRRTHSETILTGDDVARDLAVVFLDRYKEPEQRVPAITVPVGANPTVIFPAVLARELVDRVTVRRTPQGTGTVNSSEQLVEGIRHSFNSKQWTTTLQMSPGFITTWFTFDSATLGALNDDVLGG